MSKLENIVYAILMILGAIGLAALALCAFIFIIFIGGHFGDFLGMWDV